MDECTNMPASDRLPRGCRLINLPEHKDLRGSLAIAEAMHHVPFAIERVFWIYDVPEGGVRGAHSHCECAEVVVPVCGAFDMMVDDGNTKATVHLDSPHTGILIPAGVWCQLSNFSQGTVCVVMASHPYNASGYIHDYSAYKGGVIEVVPYDAPMAGVWNAFVENSRNGTFLFNRDYMDYHADRFADCSLMFYKKSKLVALLPANYKREECTVCSHGGLTYGGLVLSDKISVTDTMLVMSCAMEWMKLVLGAERWIYKPVPHIYHRSPAEEDLYALFRLEGKVVSRLVASAICNDNRLPMRTSRKQCVVKAGKNNLVYEESQAWEDFWPLLKEVLSDRHNANPVHSLEEMKLLGTRFPNNIRLFVARHDGKIMAGAVIYETEAVAHAQYLAVSDDGIQYCALDGLIAYLIEVYYASKHYFDFGTSMLPTTGQLSESLVFQKEGFGARTVVYDTYEIKL